MNESESRAARRSNQLDEHDVFISYASADESEADGIRAKLEAAGLSCFMSSKSLGAGDNWAERIRSALVNSREICVLCSPSSKNSEWVLTEWGAAWALEKLTVPVLHRVDVGDLPERLRSKQAIDLARLDSYVSQAKSRKQAESKESQPGAERISHVAAQLTEFLESLKAYYEGALESTRDSVGASVPEKDLKKWKYQAIKFLDANCLTDEATPFASLHTNEDGAGPSGHISSSYEAHREFLESLRGEVMDGRAELRATPAPSGNRLPQFGSFTYAR